MNVRIFANTVLRNITVQEEEGSNRRMEKTA
jgi:hypothetical protein